MLSPARHSSKSSTLPYQDMASRLPHFGSQAGKGSRFRLFRNSGRSLTVSSAENVAWGALREPNREPYSIMEYLPATGIADGHPAREALRAGAVIADSLPSGSLRVDRIGFGVVDAVTQRLDRRRRLGIRHHRELDRRPRVRLLGLRDQELPARSRSGSGPYTFDAKPRDIQSAVVRLSYKFGAPVVAKY
jgi:hypothetical protein